MSCTPAALIRRRHQIVELARQRLLTRNAAGGKGRGRRHAAIVGAERFGLGESCAGLRMGGAALDRVAQRSCAQSEARGRMQLVALAVTIHIPHRLLGAATLCCTAARPARLPTAAEACCLAGLQRSAQITHCLLAAAARSLRLFGIGGGVVAVGFLERGERGASELPRSRCRRREPVSNGHISRAASEQCSARPWRGAGAAHRPLACRARAATL